MTNTILQKMIAVLSVLCLMLSTVPFSVFAAESTDSLVGWDGTIAASFEGGSGTADDPYIIVNGAQLARVAEIDTYNVHFRLEADILLNDTSDWEQWGQTDSEGYVVAPTNMWTPIYVESRAVFDGNGHTIYGLYIYRPNRSKIGLCSYVYGEVRNVTIAQSFVGGGNFVGAVAGSSYGTIVNCRNSATVSGSDYVGGVVGDASEPVTECNNSGTVSGKYYVGGVVGDGEATGCYNSGIVNGKYDVGGVVGDGEATGCYNSGIVSGSDYVGGIVGDGQAVNCFNLSVVNGKYNVGGVVGNGSATNSYNGGTVSGSDYVGGVVGQCVSRVAYCYNRGAVSGNNEIGGVVGCLSWNGVVENGYYLDTAVEGVSEYGIPLTNEQMQQADSFVGFNFRSVWELGYDETYPYPTLRTFGSQEYMYSVTLIDGESIVSQTLYNAGETFNLTPPANAEFDFAYWRRPDGTRVYASDTLTAEQDETLTAVWAIRRTSANAWDGSIDIDWQGSGTKDDPYLITSAAELAGVSAENKKQYGWDDTTYFKLTTDILLNDGGDRFAEYLVGKHEWTPIGDGYSFCAHFDGDGHAVYGLCVNRPNEDNIGLFGRSSGTIRDLTVADAFVCGNESVGGIVGYSVNHTVTACINTGTVSGGYRVGGVVGYGNATACRNSGTVNGKNSYAGGVVGYGNATACHNSGTVTGDGYVGGVAGYGDATDCYSNGNVQGGVYVGGVAGYGNVVRCYNIGTVTGKNSSVGGVVGTDYYTAVDSYYLDACLENGNENGIPLTAEQMQQADSFVGFNFRSVWELGYDESYPYPTLRALGSREYSYVVTLQDGETVLSETIYPHGSTIDLTPPQNAHYNFAYWRRSDNTRVYPSETLNAEQDETLTAVWMVRRTSASAWNGEIDTDWRGSGTADDPYLITSVAELAGIAQENDEHYGWDNEVYFKLTTDLVLNDGGEQFDDFHVGRYEWTPIGNNDWSFDANFDGGGHTVSGLYINRPDEGNIGLFGEANGTISDLTIEKSFIQGGEDVGSVVGYTYYGVIERCHNHGTVIGDCNVGGVVGYSYYYTVTACSNTGAVSGRDCVGGIAGTTYFENVVDSHNSGTVSGTETIGGIAGAGSVLNSRNSGLVIGSSYYAGGVVGRGTSQSCVNEAAVQSDDYVGGIVGNGEAFDSYNYGAVQGDSHVGGVAGDGEAIGCRNSGKVHGEYYVGGVMGDGEATGCYNAGEVQGEMYVGGVMGDGDSVNSHNAGTISGIDFVGGVIGHGEAQNSYNLGVVQGDCYIGGVVGCGTATDSYNIGAVQGETYVGGVVGNTTDVITDCYNRGSVSGVSYVGGAVGCSYYPVEECYYLDTSVQGDSEQGTPLSEEQMKTAESYVGFDFETYWTIDPEASYPYPTLTGNEHVDYVTVTFLNDDGAVLQSDRLVKGERIVYPDTASLWREDERYVYRFLRWDKTPYSADEDYTIRATYEKVEKLTIAPMALAMTVDYGYSFDNLRVDTESLYRRLVLSTASGYRVMSEMTWDLEAYDPTVAGDYILVGTAALLDSPYYKAGGDITLTVTVLEEGDQTHLFKENDLVYEVQADGTASIVGYNGTAQYVTIPATIGDKAVTCIGDGAFENNTALLSVRLPSTVSDIGEEAFAGCANLREIALPDGVQTIGTRAFYDTALPSITCGAAIASIGEYAFGFYGAAPTKTEGFLVCGYADTEAARYAIDNGFGYVVTTLAVDEVTGVSAVIDERVTLAVVPVTEGAHFETATEILENTDGVTMFDITVHNTDAEAVQPDNMITVSIPLPERYQSSECRIYRINDDGSFKDMKATVVGDKVVFQTSHLSYYAVISVAEDIVIGDINGDGTTNMMDALRLFAAMSGAATLDEEALAASDITGDGNINMLDALALYGRVSGS